MSRYAATTTVSWQRSRDEIERTLTRYGAEQFLYGWKDEKALVAFRMGGRQIRFVLALPDRHDREFTHHSKGPRTADAAEKAWDQAVKQRWRALALVIKAKLEAVESGIATFEDEFMANTVLPDGQSVGEFMRPQIAIAYDNGEMPKLLPDYTRRDGE